MSIDAQSSMRSLFYGILLASLTFTQIQAAPTGSPHQETEAQSHGVRPPGLLSDARRGYARPQKPDSSTAEQAIKKVKGKEKLLDSSYQLDRYLSTNKARRPTVMTQDQRQPKLSQNIKIDSKSKMEGTSAQDVAAKTGRTPTSRLSDPASPSPSSSSPPYGRAPISKRLQRERKAEFLRHWEAQNLSTDLHPHLLAEKVFALRALGVRPHTIGTHAPPLVKVKGDKDYTTRYAVRMRQMSHMLSETSARLKKSPRYDEMSGKARMQRAIKETLQQARDGRLKKTLNVRDPDAPVANDAIAAMKIEHVGRLAQEHLKKKKLDLFSISLDKVEKNTRDFKVPGMEPKQSTRLLNRFVQHRRSAKNVDMARIRLARHKYNSKRCRDRCRQVVSSESGSNSISEGEQ